MQPSLNDPDNLPADRPADHPGTRPVIDLREVCCGLVPAILAELAKAQADEVDVQIRAGMETEIISGFGSGGNWQLCFQASFGFGLARFTRRAAEAGPKVRLDTLDY